MYKRQAKDIARNTRGPIASIYYQGLMRIDQGIDVVEKSVAVSYTHLDVYKRQSHDFYEKQALMGSGCITDFVHSIQDRVQRGVVADSGICSIKVIVDSSRQPDTCLLYTSCLWAFGESGTGGRI